MIMFAPACNPFTNPFGSEVSSAVVAGIKALGRVLRSKESNSKVWSIPCGVYVENGVLAVGIKGPIPTISG